LADSKVLLDGIADGLSLLTWQNDTFAHADSYDEALGRHRGLRTGNVLLKDSGGVLVKPDAARRQTATEQSIGSSPAEGTSVQEPAGTERSSTENVPATNRFLNLPRQHVFMEVLGSMQLASGATRDVFQMR
jgi:hypothetical protein